MARARMVQEAGVRLGAGWVLLAVCLGQFMIQLDLTAVNVALPDVARSLGSSTPVLQWVVDAYNLTVASLLLTGGRTGDRMGHKRVYLAGLVVFGVASALCAAAPGANTLIAFRVLQGAGAAVELPATLAILTHSFPDPAERAQAVGIWTGAAGSALVVGPVLGGALVAALGWRAVFVINVPITLGAVVLTMLSIRETVEAGAQGVDLPGQVLGAVSLGLLAAGSIEGGRGGFGGAVPIGLLIGGVIAGVLFVTVEARSRHAMLPLRYFSRPLYAAANANGLVMGFVTIGLLFLFSLFFQQAQGLSAIAAGVRFIPWTVTFVLIGPVVGRHIERIGHRLPMTLGCALLAAGALLLVGAHPDSSYVTMWGPFVLLGAGYGLLSTPMAAAVLGAVPASRAGMASSTNLTARLVGGVFGVAVLGSLLPQDRGATAFSGGLHDALYVCAAIALLGAANSWTFIRAERPRSG